jgi:hypothetical protein
MKRLLTPLAVVLILLTTPFAAFAEDSELEETGALFLLFPAGTRNAAMGGTGVADYSDPINVIYNPANISLMRGGAFQGSYTEWPYDIKLVDVGIYGGKEHTGYEAYQSNIAGSIRFSKSHLDLTDELTNVLPDTLDRKFGDDWYVPLTFAAAMTKATTYVAGGATVKFVNIGFEDGTVLFTTWDFGVTGGFSPFSREPYLIDVIGGMSWSNRGGTILHNTYEAKPPDEFRAGLSFKFQLIDSEFSRTRSLFTIDVNTDFLDSRQASGYAIGTELGIIETAFLRIGKRDEIFMDGGYSFGVGLQLKIKRLKIRADYAKVPGPMDETSDVLGLMIGTLY